MKRSASCAGRIVSGELHYPRVPWQYWRERLAMARAMGLNTISTYVFWNRHEPREGVYDFVDDNDVASFIRLAQDEGLNVVLRPGPYVCAEWDWGGLPAWLLRDGEITVRTMDERFMRPVRRWLQRLGNELAMLQAAYGGPIIAVQLENEYGAFGEDAKYLSALHKAVCDAGFGVSPRFTIDQPGDLARGALSHLPIAVTFAPGDPGAQFAQVHALRPGAPLLCGEYWAGWFDHWGEPRAVLDTQCQADDLEWMLARGISVNIYMFHGGTNFGFWNGANASGPHPYQPTTTSYDYQAALDEAGRPTEKFWRFREIIARQTGIVPAVVPAPPSVVDIAAFTLCECAPVSDVLVDGIESEFPLSMEALGQSLGFVWYRAFLNDSRGGRLSINGLRDYAIVMVDGCTVQHLDRRQSQFSVQLSASSERPVLDILVENCGRINYGPLLRTEQKGIIGDVCLNGHPVRGWRCYSLALETVRAEKWERLPASTPAFYRGSFDIVSQPGDTFLDVTEMRKGALWVNGRNVGRFWDIGPQRSLFVPGVWLKRGRNDVIALELFGRESFPRVGKTPPNDAIRRHGSAERPHFDGQ